MPIARPVRTKPAIRRALLDPQAPISKSAAFEPDPYLDYGRFLTAEGGILIVYKDIDTRWWHTLWRICAWIVATGAEGWFLYHHPHPRHMWINAVLLLAAALLNWLIVRKPVEVYRQVEFRRDCMILDDTDIFWCRYMDASLPRFVKNDEGHHVLSGVYGTRHVEYLTARRFDDNDRSPEVFAAHIEHAMAYLWMRPP